MVEHSNNHQKTTTIITTAAATTLSGSVSIAECTLQPYIVDTDDNSYSQGGEMMLLNSLGWNIQNNIIILISFHQIHFQGLVK